MTLTRFHVKASTPQEYRWWRGGKAAFRHERRCERNDAIMKRLFEATMSGEIKGFYLNEPENDKGWKPLKAYHRSTKADDTVQLSSGWWHNGEVIACYDIQMKAFDDFQREGYSSGIWETIV